MTPTDYRKGQNRRRCHRLQPIIFIAQLGEPSGYLHIASLSRRFPMADSHPPNSRVTISPYWGTSGRL
ncbi:MAG TPA: hypothetical protein IGS52_18675 [Oscillatoriaceae cyanobacterium M33_DOE_052]|uniref:Uncharacterized protein n=1 Tax=Planktothricoides sp. SpSt-374 TaxID=2282167 RepID=A0A7C3VV44_9CYAN|nr:hypothetical protein [Oscillatoriaceae cyanobacterium M33_DOE_052]